MAKVQDLDLNINLVFNGVKVSRAEVIKMEPGDAMAFYFPHRVSDQDAMEITGRVREQFNSMGWMPFPILVFGPDEGVMIVRAGELRRFQLPDEDERPSETVPVDRGGAVRPTLHEHIHSAQADWLGKWEDR